jgi:class 3 adenylate cyclase/tetratricopeptide (TPR) repeat protein
MVERRSATYTFLFTDIVGSSMLWEQAPESMDVALAQHDALLRNTIAVHGGHVFKSLGDGLAAVFTDANGALGAAMSAQRALHAEHWSAGTPLRVRMGLQTGPARPRDGDYYSQTVNRVARLVGVAGGGQIVLSEATAAAVSPDLPPDVRLRALGEHYFRGMSRPENVFQVVLPDLPEAAEATRESATPAEIDAWQASLLTPPTDRAGDNGGAALAPHPTPSEAQALSVLDTPFIPSYPFPVPERLIGREAELDALGAILEQGRSTLQVVLVSAPAGTGKSTLVGALTRQARRNGTLCLVGGGHEEEGVVPRGPFQEALADYLLTQPPVRVMAEIGSVVDDLTFVIPELRRHLTLADRSASSAAPDRAQLFGAISVCLRALTERQPVFLCLEDLHAVSSATLALIQALTHSLRRRPLVILGTYRSEELTAGQPLAELVTMLRREGATQIQLQPLSEDQTTTLAAALLDGQPSQQLSASLYQSTEGNPLFIEQLLLVLREDGRLDRRRGGTWHQHGAGLGTIPTIVRDVISKRLERLTDDVRRTLELAAVLGQTVDHQALLAIFGSADEDTLLDHLDEAFNAQILQETPNGWAFVHALIREVLYAGLTAPRRMRLHARVGDVLERLAGPKADEQAAELARHFALGGRSPSIREKALRYSLVAGRRANGLSAYREALRHFTQACELVAEAGDDVDLAVRLDALEGCGRAARVAGAWRQCTERFSELLAICDDPLRRARARNDIARALSSIGQTADALVECNAGLAELEAVEDGPESIAVRLRLQYDLALLHFLAGRYRQLRALADEMLGAAQHLVEPAHLSIAHSVMAWSYMALDHVDAALAQFQLALEAGERIGNRELMAVAHVNLGIQNYRGARFAAARPELERAIALFREAAGDVRAINGIQTLARVWLAEGDLARAEEQVRLAEDIVANGEHRWAAECHDVRGTILAARAQWESAESSFREAIRIRQQVGHMAGLVESLLGLGLVYERRGRWLEATGAYGSALDVARAMDPSPQGMAAERQYGRLLRRRNCPTEAAEHIQAACTLGETMPRSLEYAPTLLAAAELAVLDAPRDAADLAERVISLGSSVEVHIEARALAVRAFVALARLDRADFHADQAVELATRLGTPYSLGLAHLAKARADKAAGRPAAEQAASAALEHFAVAGTPYERAIALLACATLAESLHPEDSRSREMRLEADRLVNALVE